MQMNNLFKDPFKQRFRKTTLKQLVLKNRRFSFEFHNHSERCYKNENDKPPTISIKKTQKTNAEGFVRPLSLKFVESH